MFRVYLTVVEAVILILKHATLLRLSNFISSSSTLTQVEQNYQEANISLKIQQYLDASPQEHSIELHAGFIMATHFGLFILASIQVNSLSWCRTLVLRPFDSISIFQ